MRALVALVIVLVPALAVAEPIVMCDGTELPAGHVCARTQKKGTWTCCEASKARSKGEPRAPTAAPVDMIEIEPAAPLVPGGCRGKSCGDEPAYDLSVNAAFFVDRTEVTQSAYERCVRAGKCTVPVCSWDPGAAAHGEHPVACVTWSQARAFCEWRDARLPTEAQWEVAARGDDARRYPWGEAEPACHRANFDECGGAALRTGDRDAGQSPFGVLDLGGNVEEWTADAAPCAGDADKDAVCRVARGGAFSHGTAALVTWSRRVYPADAPAATRGFRCARGESPGVSLVRRPPAKKKSRDHAAAAAPAPPPRNRARNRAILFTGTSVATLALAGFFTWSAKADWEDSKTECEGMDDCALQDTAKSEAILAAVFGVAGVTAGGVALYFWLESDEPPVPTQTKAALLPLPGGAAVTLSGGF